MNAFSRDESKMRTFRRLKYDIEQAKDILIQLHDQAQKLPDECPLETAMDDHKQTLLYIAACVNELRPIYDSFTAPFKIFKEN